MGTPLLIGLLESLRSRFDLVFCLESDQFYHADLRFYNLRKIEKAQPVVGLNLRRAMEPTHALNHFKNLYEFFCKFAVATRMRDIGINLLLALGFGLKRNRAAPDVCYGTHRFAGPLHVQVHAHELMPK